jgi:hypothetical protein
MPPPLRGRIGEIAEIGDLTDANTQRPTQLGGS